MSFSSGLVLAEHVEEPADEPEGDRTAHANDRGGCPAQLLRGLFLSLHPSSSMTSPWRVVSAAICRGRLLAALSDG